MSILTEQLSEIYRLEDQNARLETAIRAALAILRSGAETKLWHARSSEGVFYMVLPLDVFEQVTTTLERALEQP